MMEVAVRALEWIALFLLTVLGWYILVRVTVTAAMKSYYDAKCEIVCEDFEMEEEEYGSDE